MPDELLLDHDPISGMTEWISTDEETGETFIRYEQDVSPILDYNKEMQAESFDKRSDMWHAAKVPNVVAMEWLTKYGVQMWNPRAQGRDAQAVEQQRISLPSRQSFHFVRSL